MKIQLDTKNKTIKIEEKVNLNEFYKIIKKMLPNNEWQEYSFDSSVIYNWHNPITYYPYVEKSYPWLGTLCTEIGTGSSSSVVMGANDTTSAQLYSSDIFNIQIQN